MICLTIYMFEACQLDRKQWQTAKGASPQETIDNLNRALYQ